MNNFTINSTSLFDVQIENDQVRIEILVDTDQGVFRVVDFYPALDQKDFIREEVAERMEEQKIDKFDNMRELLYSRGFTKEDIADLAEYQQY